MATEVFNESPVESDTPPELAPVKATVPPSRKDIDFLRGSWQVTPADINNYIDRHRPWLLAAGFTNSQIDEHYGVETFDADAATKSLVAHAAEADMGELLPQGGPFGAIAHNPDLLKAIGTSAGLYSNVAAMQSPRGMRGEVRRQLIQAYRTGACDTANGYRRSIMATLTGSDGLARQHVDGWLGEILPGPVFDELGRVMSNDALVVEGLIRSSLAQRSLRSFGMAPGAANAFSFALFDHDMPDAKTFYNVGAIGQFVGSGGKIRGVQTADVGNATTSAVPEDWPPQRDTYFKAVGNIVKNTMDAYVGYNINPFLIAARGMEHPGLFRELMSDTPDIRLFFPEETKFGPYKDNSGGIDRGFELAAEGELNNNAPVPEEMMPDSEPEDEGNSEYKDGIIGGGFTPQMWMLKNRIDAEKKRAEEGIPKSPEVDAGVPSSSEGSSPVPPQKVIPPSIANSKETVSRTLGAEPAAAGSDPQNRLNLKESEKNFLSPRPKVDNQSPQAQVSGITRAGKAFTKKGGQIILENNRQKYQGVTRCEKCGVQTVPGERHRRGVTPPNNETHKDHVISRSKGGAGLPENGQVLCRACNLDKSDK